MLGINTRIKIFAYVEPMDGFIINDTYRMLADEFGLTEWNPVVWIGRLFLLDKYLDTMNAILCF